MGGLNSPVSPPFGERQMSQEWFYTRDGKNRIGPISTAQLQALARSGELVSTDMVCKAGMTQWMAAGAVKGLFTQVKLAATPNKPLARTTLEPAPSAAAPPDMQHRTAPASEG